MDTAHLPDYLRKLNLHLLQNELKRVSISHYDIGDGRRIYLYMIGAKNLPKLILLPPYGMSYLLISRLACQLAERFQVLCWESIGCPDSNIPIKTTDFDLAWQASIFINILRQQSYKNCHFVGWCQAAQLVVHAIKYHGFSPSSMVWIAPAGLTSTTVDSEFERCALPIYLQIEQHGLAHAKKFSVILDKYRNQPLCGDDLAEKLSLLHLTNQKNTLVFSRYMRTYEKNKQIMQSLLLTTLGKHPTLIIHCKDDNYSHYSSSVKLAKHYPSIHLDLLERGGHLILFNNPNAVSQRIIKFIDAQTGKFGLFLKTEQRQTPRHIPNNIGLISNSILVKQLTAYQKKFHKWWSLCGPDEFLDRTMKLRIPTGHTQGRKWAEYHWMRPSDYLWGVYMMPPAHHNTVSFGERKGKAIWSGVPDEYRSLLLEHIMIQGDVENAAVEQSHKLTQIVPSFIDLENLFQFFLEEGRHTWAMSHLLIEYFGSEGGDAAEGLLERMSGDTYNPRLLDAFNYHTEDWLSHFMWCFFADRVGMYQIQAVTKSAFQPLARTASFMMLEEPLHIRFGVDGLERILYRSAEITLHEDTYDIFNAGGIPLPIFQKYINYWVPKIFDLFGHDVSERSRILYQAGIRSPRNFNNSEGTEITVDVRSKNDIRKSTAPADLAINAVMRRQYIAEINSTFERWNKQFRRIGLDFQLQIPHERFCRKTGPCKGLSFDINGKLITDTQNRLLNELLPKQKEVAKIRELMNRELNSECTADWIAPPATKLQKLFLA